MLSSRTKNYNVILVYFYFLDCDRTILNRYQTSSHLHIHVEDFLQINAFIAQTGTQITLFLFLTDHWWKKELNPYFSGLATESTPSVYYCSLLLYQYLTFALLSCNVRQYSAFRFISRPWHTNFKLNKNLTETHIVKLKYPKNTSILVLTTGNF